MGLGLSNLCSLTPLTPGAGNPLGGFDLEESTRPEIAKRAEARHRPIRRRRTDEGKGASDLCEVEGCRLEELLEGAVHCVQVS